jgi:hypothetical protein
MQGEVTELKARGVRFENDGIPGENSPSGGVTVGDAKRAWFKDTERSVLDWTTMAPDSETHSHQSQRTVQELARTGHR